MNTTTIDIAENYYTAMSQKDLPKIEKYLHPDVVLLSPLAEVVGKESVAISIKNFMAFFESLKIKLKFGSEDHAVVVYEVDFPNIGKVRSVALMSFKKELISRIELFYDARPFEEKKSDIFTQK